MAKNRHRALAVLTATLLAATIGGIAAPSPARAGGWAATVLEPMPATLRPGETYTVGMWVLQHGFHPFEGKLDEVALRLVDAKGTASTFPAVPLREPAHYAVSVVLPHDGPFTVVGVQGWFPEYQVGTISAAGGLRQLPTVTPLTKEHLAEYWPGPVKPPVLPVDETRDPFAAGAARPVGNAVVDARPVAATTPSSPSGPSPWLAALAGVAALVLAGSVVLGRRRLGPPRRP